MTDHPLKFLPHTSNNSMWHSGSYRTLMGDLSCFYLCSHPPWSLNRSILHAPPALASIHLGPVLSLFCPQQQSHVPLEVHMVHLHSIGWVEGDITTVPGYTHRINAVVRGTQLMCVPVPEDFPGIGRY